MVGCAAFGCTNRSEKGMQMYGFPKERDRRKKWLAMVSRSNMTITQNYNNRKLCQAHFEEDQFISTKKGQMKLRADAIPTVFVHRSRPKRRKAPSLRLPEELLTVTAVTSDHNYYATNTCEIEGEFEEREGADCGKCEVNEMDIPVHQMHPVSEHLGSQHPVSEHLGSQHPVSEHPVSEHLGSQHPVSEHLGSQHPVSEHPVSEHLGSQHPVSEHLGSEHPGSEHPGSEPGANQPEFSQQDLKEELKTERAMRRRAESALKQQKKINAALRQKNIMIQKK
ncbi:THAP domain-containing protein 6-like [Trichomycterus rosablanca]|uniref:THAP domain-containing protein 6-like n=1 Tax=Trichomycterus rosablanca TaxID=2290929 RepID=UPI002F35350F